MSPESSERAQDLSRPSRLQLLLSRQAGTTRRQDVERLLSGQLGDHMSSVRILDPVVADGLRLSWSRVRPLLVDRRVVDEGVPLDLAGASTAAVLARDLSDIVNGEWHIYLNEATTLGVIVVEGSVVLRVVQALVPVEKDGLLAVSPTAARGVLADVLEDVVEISVF